MFIEKKFGLALILSSMLYTSITPSMVFADETDTVGTAKIINTGNVMVTATRSEKDLLDVPMSVSVVTAEEIQEQGYTSVAQILNSIPGVHFDHLGSPRSNLVRIRGEATDKNLILIDGHRLSSLDDVNGLAFSIDPASIERIEVIKGAASVLYGAEALGGVINIITKKGGERPVQGEIKSTYSTFDNGVSSNASLFGSYNGFNYRLLAAYDDLGDHLGSGFGANDRRVNSGQENTSVNTFLSYDFSDKFTVGASYEHYNEVSHGNSFNGMDPYKLYDGFSTSLIESFIKNETLSESVTTRDHYTIFATANKLTEYLSRLHFDAYYSDYTTESKRSVRRDTGTLYDSTDYIDPTVTWGVNAQADWTIGDHTFIITGYEYISESLDKATDTYMSSTSPYIKSTAFREASQQTHAAFISVDHYLPYDFTLNYGTRYTHFTSQEDRMGTLTYDTGLFESSTLNSDDGNDADFVFNASLVWSGIDNLALRALWSQGFKPATIRDRYISIAPSSRSSGYLANPDLKAERSDNYEIGARYDNGKFVADVAIFFMEATDYISSEEISPVNVGGNLYTTQLQNIASVTSKGIEYLFSYNFDNGLTPYISGNWMTRDTGSTTPDYGIPTLTAKLGLRYAKTFADKYHVNADINMVAQDGIDYGDGIQNPGYATMNATFGLEYGEQRNFFAQVALNNIFDAEYTQRYPTNAYESGFNAAFTLGYRF